MAPPSEQEIADYRAALAELMARCLERIRSLEIPADAEPLQGWAPDE
jgi:hypothetical protein